jgi:hypothetical protein
VIRFNARDEGTAECAELAVRAGLGGGGDERLLVDALLGRLDWLWSLTGNPAETAVAAATGALAELPDLTGRSGRSPSSAGRRLCGTLRSG